MFKIERILTKSLIYFILINVILLIKGYINGEMFSAFCLSLSLICPILCGWMTVLWEQNKAKAEKAG